MQGEEEIWGWAWRYEWGKKVLEFPVITGDDETTTEPGIYLVRVKEEDYYSRQYQTPMPYSIFQLSREKSDSRRSSTAAAAEKRISHPWLRAHTAALRQVVI
ncbi:MAG: L,D-transpeptidase [Desulfobaccales bacterium]